MTRSYEERLDDIRAVIDRCLSYRRYLDSAEFGAMAYDAVLRNLAVIGEAVKALPADMKAAHHEVAWPAIAGLLEAARLSCVREPAAAPYPCGGDGAGRPGCRARRPRAGSASPR